MFLHSVEIPTDDTELSRARTQILVASAFHGPRRGPWQDRSFDTLNVTAGVATIMVKLSSRGICDWTGLLPSVCLREPQVMSVSQ